MKRPSHPSAGEISAALAARMLELAAELLPQGRRVGAEWVCGSVAGEPGRSLSVHLVGVRAGIWADFSADLRGDALDLVAAVLFAGDRGQAYKWSINWLGYGSGSVPTLRRATVNSNKKAQDQDEETARRIRAARKMWLSAQPVTLGDPVAHYLAGRNIDLGLLDHVPRALRFEANHWCSEIAQPICAMLATFTGADGESVATHQTFIKKTREGWQKAKLRAPKKILGPYSAASIRLARGASGRSLKDADPGEEVLIGEGIETCLSVAVCCPEFRVLAAGSLNNLGRVALPEQIRNVTILADNDENKMAQRALRGAVKMLQERGLRVRLARPPCGKDFNDALICKKG